MLPRIFAIGAVLAWAILLSPYSGTVFLAACFASLSLPIYRFLRARMKSFWAVTCYSSSIVVMVLTPFVILTSLVVPQAITGLQALYTWRASGWQLSPDLTARIDSIHEWIMGIPGLNDAILELSSNLTSMFNSLMRSLLSGSIGFAGSALSALWLITLFVILTIIFAIYAPTIRKVAQRILNLPETSMQRLLMALHQAIKAVFIGIVFVSMIQGVLCGIGMAITGVKDPAFWGLLAMIVAVVPVVGTAIVWVPMALMLWINGSLGAAIALAIWCAILVSSSDNLIRPFFLKTGIEASMFVLLLAIVCGVVVFGPIGLVAGPLLVAFALFAIKESDILLGIQPAEKAEHKPQLSKKRHKRA